ncbi:hypothetical protein FOYG_17196 [Fusarium oxysporum NRRL 32931]|uniref:Uncharacterized protein n=1 Tax=Fusarium oxysporum NRRL 32931 TaxID=660029 RepID=W9HBL0_FUSOX|nr:hypothetical protein FOYG_17196 [Fusarium oxysporum NRRL 32931]
MFPKAVLSILTTGGKYGISSSVTKQALQFRNRLESLPKEMQDYIGTFLRIGSFSLECNYLMLQSMWKKLFFQVSYLRDLDTKVLQEKLLTQHSKAEDWDWEDLTRRVISPAQVPGPEPYKHNDAAWGHHKVGLSVPGGFANRRRIWQILEQMYPNDAQF